MTNQSIPHPNERMAQWCWTAFILMFFMIQATIWTVAISLTAGDESHAIVANYDEQALQWDEIKSVRQQSAQLGWNSEILIDRNQDDIGRRAITIKLTNDAGEPVTGAAFNVRAFHRGAAAKPQQLTFGEVGPGVYASKVTAQRFGKWCVVGSAKVGEQVFLIDDICLISKLEN